MMSVPRRVQIRTPSSMAPKPSSFGSTTQSSPAVARGREHGREAFHDTMVSGPEGAVGLPIVQPAADSG